MAQYEIQTPDEPTMFAAAQGLGFIPAATVYAQGVVGSVTGGVVGGVAWAANIYGVKRVASGTFTTDPTTGAQIPVMTIEPGFYGVLEIADTYVLPGDTQTLASRVWQTDPATQITTASPFVFNGVTINAVPPNSPVVFS